MRSSTALPRKRTSWSLYWVESDGREDCFVAARSSRSACDVEIDMNGLDPGEVRATRVTTIPPAAERAHRKAHPDTRWPGYVYGKDFFKHVGAEFRTVNETDEMLLDDIVYEIADYVPCFIIKKYPVGHRAVRELRALPLRSIETLEEDSWDDRTITLITGLGMCMATCQLIEDYIARSFLLGISKKQKAKHATVNDITKAWRKKTFGDMLRCIEEAWEIEPVLKANLDLFRTNRNLLIHRITTDERFDIRTSWGQKELLAFLSFFDVHARVVKMAFRSSYFASILFSIQRFPKLAEGLNKKNKRKLERDAGLFPHFFKPKEGAI